MTDTLRTLLAAVVGAVVTVAVVVGQPALASQADRGKAQKVTSAQIKDGTIRTRDLSAEVTGPLAEAGTALQSVPDGGVTTSKLADGSVTAGKVAANAVTSAKVADHSLAINDLAFFSGSNTYDIPPLPAGGCAASAGIETGHNTTGDLFLVSQPAGVAGAIQVTGRSDAVSLTAMDIVWCNVGTAAFNPPASLYTYADIDN